MNEMMKIKISLPVCFSEIGQKENQEDALYPPRELANAEQRVFVLCDGMGGHAHGEVASQCVAHTVGKYVEEALGNMAEEALQPSMPCPMRLMREFFDEALEMAYAELDRRDDAARDEARSGATMGTTLTFLGICSDGLLAVHIGDSRIYQFRPGKGVVFCTRDHSLVSELVLAGEITEEEARTHPRRNVITRAVQPHQEHPARATFDALTDVRQGDVLMLSCDGVTEQVTDEELAELMLQSWPLAERVETLRKLCAKRHTRDNHTCWALEVEQVDADGDAAGDACAARVTSARVSALDALAPKTLADARENAPACAQEDAPVCAQEHAQKHTMEEMGREASSQCSPSRHAWLVALLVVLALACFVAGFWLFRSASSGTSGSAAPAESAAPQVESAPSSSSNDCVQGTITRERTQR